MVTKSKAPKTLEERQDELKQYGHMRPQLFDPGPNLVLLRGKRRKNKTENGIYTAVDGGAATELKDEAGYPLLVVRKGTNIPPRGKEEQGCNVGDFVYLNAFADPFLFFTMKYVVEYDVEKPATAVTGIAYATDKATITVKEYEEVEYVFYVADPRMLVGYCDMTQGEENDIHWQQVNERYKIVK